MACDLWAGRIDYGNSVVYEHSPNNLRLRIKMSEIDKDEPGKEEGGLRLKTDGR